MRTSLLLALLFVVLPAMGQPFAVADVVVGVTSCGVFLDAATKVTVPASAGKCSYDLSAVSVGAHSIKMTAIANDPLWGVQESAPTGPLAFTRPAAGVAQPTTLTIKATP